MAPIYPRLIVVPVIFHSLLTSVNCFSTCHVIPAQRVCKPGPLLPAYGKGPSCLIIGDSISIGYTRFVAMSLRNDCHVHHAPFDFDYGGALDTNYGVKCLQLWLRNLKQAYDAIVFNFGLHDIGCVIGSYEESVSSVNYHKNLAIMKNVLLSTGSGIGFVLTTPVPYSKSKNFLVTQYNKIAQNVMSRHPKIPVLDLYKKVIDRCGIPPYNNCSITLKGARNLHYNSFGSEYLAKAVSKFLKRLLFHHQKQQSSRNQHENSDLTQTKKMNNETSIVCNNESGKTVGVCPQGTTCSPQAHSVTGFGCCLLRDAVVCNDSYHCCPRDWVCDPLCNQKRCHCQVMKT